MTKTMFITALILAAGLGTGLAQEAGTVEYHRVQSFSTSGPETKVSYFASPGCFSLRAPKWRSIPPW